MAASTRDPLNLTGTVLAQKYEIEEAVAEGGFSIVYRARHKIWKKPIAIKVFNALALPPGELRDALQEAFLKEGALLAELSSLSTSIVQAWDVGTHTSEEGSWFPYLVLEWLEGKALDHVLAECRTTDRPLFTLGECMHLLAPVAHALSLAHKRGIAHRDLKPENVFVLGDVRGDGATLKLLDFGVAKVMDEKVVRAALAKTGGTIKTFTPEYGAPEQFTRSRGATGPWTDVFQLALVMVEMLSGTRALVGANTAELATCSINAEVRPTPRNRGTLLPGDIEHIFERALAVQPSDRYESAAAFWSDLSAAAEVRTASKGYSSPAPVSQQVPPSAASSRDSVALPSSPVSQAASAPSHEAPLIAMTATESDTRHSDQPQVYSSPVVKARTVIPVAIWMVGLLGLGALGAVAFFLWPRAEVAKLQSAAAIPPDLSGVAQRFRCPPGMVKIPAGQFFMGSDLDEATPAEKPAFAVKLDSYCIDIHEVTVDQYLQCSKQGKCKRPSTTVRWPKITDKHKKTYSEACNASDPSRGKHPINCVDYFMAERYCDMQGARLPTEAEWEFATRGPDGRVYPWGDEAPTPSHLNACGSECVAWGEERGEHFPALYEADDGFATTAPVGSFPKGGSRFGPQDVAGNVWEWVADWHGPYDSKEKTNPRGPTEGERKVIRGGAFNGSQAGWLRPSFRYAQEPSALSHGIGFRCARSLGKP